eukprot:scaffold17343_cov66-Phaeocystis_antarctica.AAC.4
MAATAAMEATVETPPARRLPTRSGHAVHYQLVIVFLGFEGDRAQEQADSRSLGRDSARLAATVFGGIVGRANAGAVYSARTHDGEVGAELPVRRLRRLRSHVLYEQEEEPTLQHRLRSL